MKHWIKVFLCLVTVSWCYAQPKMMTREEAGKIVLRFCKIGNYPGRIHWLTKKDLPEKQEVHEMDTELIRRLAKEGKDWAATMVDYNATWFGVKEPYSTCYTFLISFPQWPDRLSKARVNAYTGYCEIWPFRKRDETNEELGYGRLPVKTFKELKGIALNIAEQLLGSGTFEVFDEPYDLSNPEDYNLVSKRCVHFLIFKKDPKTGAHLPKMVQLVLNPRTGMMEAGCLYNRPVTVSTTPTITEAQAKQAITKYVNQLGFEVVEWLPHGYHCGKIIHNTALGRDAVVGLYVFEGPFLEQYLMWMSIFAYKWNNETRLEMLMVNAHTGEVMEFSSKNAMLINGKLVYLCSKMISSNGQVYIPANLAYGLGAKWNGTKLIGSKGAIVVRDILRRNGQLYLPLPIICKVSGIRLSWDEKLKIPILEVEWLRKYRK